MRFDLLTIVLAHACAFNIHATPVYITIGLEEYEPIDTASIQPAVDADEVQAMAVNELLSTTPLIGIDEPIGWNHSTVDFSHDTSSIDLGSVDQGRSAASIVHEVDLLSNYYYYLVLVPLGFFGYTILKGWRTWQRERALDLRASRQARPVHRTSLPLRS